MLKRVAGGIVSALLLSGAAHAQTCASYSYNLTNGTTADASQVMSNFNTVRNCANTLASGGTLTNTTLSGTTALPGTSAFTSAGRLGIGTTTPGALLEVNTNGWGPAIQFYNGYTIGTLPGGGLYMQGAPYIWIGNPYNPGFALFSAYTGAASLQLNPQSGQDGLAINGLNFVVKSSGNVGIGTSSPSYTLHVNGSVAGTSAYNNLSDARLKKSIVPIENALATIGRLQGVHFRWRTVEERKVGKTLDLPTDEPQIGFIAQQVKEVLPEAVTVSDGERLFSMEESKVVPVLVEAVKELKTANAALRSRLDKYEQRFAELEARAGNRDAVNNNLMTRVAAVFGW